MSPEECRQWASLESDVWSLGMVVLELALKRNPFAPFKGDELRSSIQCLRLGGLPQTKFSPEAVDFVGKCLVKDANKRCSVSELMKVSVLRETEE